MIRINLLPPEITEKRRAEQRWKYVVFAAIGLYIVLATVWFFAFLGVRGQEAEVAGRKQEAESLQKQAETFRIFEAREEDLKARKVVVETALAGRRQWSRLMNETALVLPSDAWLTKLHMDEKAFTIVGQSVDSVGDASASGFKPIAKLLVHMADLEMLENVWLDTSTKSVFLSQPVINFSVAAEMSQETSATNTTAGAPAPPTQ